MLDAIDRRILAILQADARTANAEIARQVGLVPSAVLERIRRLEKQGVIQGYTARLAPKAVGLGLAAFVAVRTQERSEVMEVVRQFAKLPEVLEVHYVAGEDCILLKVRAADTEDLSRLLRERFGKIRGIVSTRSTVVLESIKETSELPIKEQE
ncbi:MAG TPA: Lrp/AsnC family transcriptional regulator [Gammaproteobacteria bacterium]|jgi:Lrp/AsnC family leucine-responsive transcriptional regulator|nr:Lrp/AsnC family transcriptional regulator [Gammaproteobacteria bacterium]